MFFNNYKTTKCINGCNLFNDNSNYLYWEKKSATLDEIEIVDYLNNFFHEQKLSILHIGVGNSHIAKNLKSFRKIDGISISGNEINYANNLNIPKYKTFFYNKLEKDVFLNNEFEKYDIIIDVNIKSFCCCQNSFEKLFYDYSNLLNKKGFIISDKRGMNWTRIVKPVIRFSFKNFFYKRLKEYDGPKENILTLDECNKISNKLNLIFEEVTGSNIVKLIKI